MKGIRIRPDQEGLKTSLFDLEAEIMDIVWEDLQAPFSVTDVCDKLQERREIAYTTVMTTVSRLYDKGLLERLKNGRRYDYSPRLSKDEFIVSLTRQVVSNLPPIGQQTAMAMLVDMVSDADESDLDALEAMIRARRSALDD